MNSWTSSSQERYIELTEGPSWSWLYGSWIYNYLCNQCLSQLIPLMAKYTLYNIMWYSLSVTCGRSVFFLGISGNLHFQQYFNYIVAASFIGGGNQSTWRKPPTCRKSPTNFITWCYIEYSSLCICLFVGWSIRYIY